MKIRNWTRDQGDNNARFGPEKSGLPSKHFIWEHVPDESKNTPDFMSIVIFENQILFGALGDYKGAMNANDGSIQWLEKYKTGRMSTIITNDKYLVVGSAVFDRSTGGLVLDYKDSLNDIKINEKSFIVLGDDFVLKEWNHDIKLGLLLYVDLKTGEKKIIESGLSFPTASDNSNEIFGWRGKQLERYDFQLDKTIWSNSILEVSERIFCAQVEDRVFFQTKNQVYCVNANTGMILFKWEYRNLAGLNSTENYVFAGYTHEEVILTDMLKFFGVYDVHAEKLRWSFKNKKINGFCFAGDLIFSILDEKKLIAWDKYTGEQIWEANEELYLAYDVRACDDKVFINSVNGTIRCYQWSNPYISPNKL